MAKLKRAVNKSKKKKNTFTVLLEYCVCLMCMSVILFISLYMKNRYFEIGQCKFDIYKVIVSLFLVLCIFLSVINLFCVWKDISIKDTIHGLSMVDWAVLSYGVVTVFSYLLSAYKENAWIGYEGWNMGLFAQLSFCILYFYVSRYAVDYKKILYVMCIASSIVFILGILNRFLIDPLGVYEGIDEVYQLQFLSTLGQSSWYSTYACTVMPLGIYFYWKAEDKISRYLFGIYTFTAFATLLTQNSDSAYMALAALVLVFFWFSVREWSQFIRFWEIVLIFAASAKIVWMFTFVADSTVIVQLDKISQFLIFGNVTWFVLIFAVIMILVSNHIKEKVGIKKLHLVLIRNIAFGLLILLLISGVVILYLSTKVTLPTFILQIPYLYWSDGWGNGRGFTWRMTWQMLTEMDVKNLLIGVGPESYPYYAYEHYKEALDAVWGGRVLSNAHNEWLNAVINYGMIGAVAYLGIFVSAIVTFGKKIKNSPIMLGILACVVTYMCHNFFCYQEVLCTPFVFMFIGIGSYIEKNRLETH